MGIVRVDAPSSRLYCIDMVTTAQTTPYNANRDANLYGECRTLNHKHSRHGWRASGRNGSTWLTRTGVAYTVDGAYIAHNGTDGAIEPERWYSHVERARQERARLRAIVRIERRIERHMATLVRQWRHRRALLASRARRALSHVQAALQATRQWFRMASVPTYRPMHRTPVQATRRL